MHQNSLFRGADIADARQQFLEIAVIRPALQALVVQREALDQILVQALRGPLAELRATRAAHAIAHRQNRVEVVVLQLPLDSAPTFRANL